MATEMTQGRRTSSTTQFTGILFLLLFYSISVAQPTATTKDSINQRINAAEILTGKTEESKQHVVRKYEFLDRATTVIASVLNDTQLDFEIQANPNISLFLEPDELKDIIPFGPDPLGDELRRRFSDVPPTTSLNNMLRSLVDSYKSKIKKAHGAEMVMPTNLEIAVLKDLWEKGDAITSSEIYVNLDTVWRVTSEDLSAILEKMTRRGLLQRKKISPSHEFSLFGIAQIELSPKNRKNKLYLYWPILNKEEIITYIDAKRYLAYEDYIKFGGNGHTEHYYQALENKLIRLLE